MRKIFFIKMTFNVFKLLSKINRQGNYWQNLDSDWLGQVWLLQTWKAKGKEFTYSNLRRLLFSWQVLADFKIYNEVVPFLFTFYSNRPARAQDYIFWVLVRPIQYPSFTLYSNGSKTVAPNFPFWDSVPLFFNFNFAKTPPFNGSGKFYWSISWLIASTHLR